MAAIVKIENPPPSTCSEGSPMPRLELGAVPGLGETKDLEQLRLLNLELLKQLWIGQEAVQRSVAKAFAKPTVTFGQGTAVPERSWRLRPYLGYDWIAGSLDSASHITDEPEAFFSTLQKFREANKEQCIHGYTEGQSQGLHGDGAEDDHQCVYCYRLNRRLFPVPVDPGAPCRLCGTPRDQRSPETLREPAQVRVSVPLSILDPPHQYRIHRRKSYDSSDTLALPRHCLLGWGSLPPTSERRSAPQSLDLWSSVSSKAQHRTLSATTPSHLTLRAPPSTPIWSEP
ncbi:migration and invasion-inhibitory protein isoform X4 [Dipodomys merriami]|uniref:migration and invasion-inhibitory protein isoform X4 n=1 Tax=Dipodomys merriami TaxID=94247 RepID=UPI0038560C10